MKKSTIITIIAFVLGIAVLTTAFILLTDNNISKGLKDTTPTTPEASTTKPTTTPAGGGSQDPELESMDFFKTDLTPYITLGQYKDLSVKVFHTEVPQSQIDLQVHLELFNAGRYEKQMQGTVAEGIVFNFNYVGYVDGVPFEGGHSAGQNAYIYDDEFIIVGGSPFVSGFAEGVLGAKIGEWFTIDATFPEKYENKDLAGKTVKFDVKVNYITKTVEPTDALIKEVTKNKYETLEAYTKYYEEKFADELESENITYIWEAIVNNIEMFEVPQQQLDYVYGALEDTVEQYVAYSQYYFGEKLDFDQVLVKLGFENKDELKEYAIDTIKYDMVIFAVANAEGIEVTEEEYNFFIAELIKGTTKTEADIIKQFGTKNVILERLLLEEANAFLVKNVTLVEGRVKE